MADAIRIGAPDGSVVEFPAGTSDAVITRVMAQNFPAPKEATSPAREEKPDKGWLRSADDAVRAIANGMTFGLADRFAAAMSSATGVGAQPQTAADLAVGKGNDYAGNLEREYRRTDEFAKEHPILSTGANLAGGAVLPLGAIGAAAKGASLGAKTLLSAGAGAGIGTVQGAVGSRDWTDPGQVAKDAAIGGAAGLVLGGAIPGVSKAVGSGVQAVTNAIRGRADGLSRSATNHLVAALEADKPAAVRTELDRLGPDAMLADAGPAFLGKAQGASLNSDEGRNVLFNALKARDQGTNRRIMSDVEAALGPAEDPATATRNIVDYRSQVDSQNYPRVLAQAPRIRTAPILTELDDAIASAVGNEQRALENLRNMMVREEHQPRIDQFTGRQAVDGRGQLAFDRVHVSQDRADVLHKVKQELDNVIEHDLPGLGVQAGALRNQQASLKHFRHELNQALEAQVPGYARANRVSQRLAQRADAVKEGTGYLGEGKTTASPSRFLDEHEQRDAGERIAFAKGSRGEIERQLGTKANDLRALQQALQGEGGWNTAKLGIVHGDQAAGDLMAAVERNLKFRDTHTKVSENSQTEIRRAAREQMKPRAESKDSPIIAPSSSITGMIATTAKRLIAKPAWEALTHVDPTRSYGEIARVLTAQGSARDRHLQSLIDAMERRNASSAAAEKIGKRSTLGAAIIANALLNDRMQRRPQ
nr:hypothetical protein [uncultured Bradyrhizobium sp.]